MDDDIKGKDLALQMFTNESSAGGTLTFTMALEVVHVDYATSEVYNVCWNNCFSPAAMRCLGDLQIRCYAWPDMASDWDVHFSQPYSVDLRRAEAMVQVLRKIQKSLEKQAAEYGRAESFGAWVLRICKALGVKWVLTEYYQHWDTPSTGYDKERFQWSKPAVGMERINARLKDWKEKHVPKVEA